MYPRVCARSCVCMYVTAMGTRYHNHTHTCAHVCKRVGSHTTTRSHRTASQFEHHLSRSRYTSGSIEERTAALLTLVSPQRCHQLERRQTERCADLTNPLKCRANGWCGIFQNHQSEVMAGAMSWKGPKVQVCSKPKRPPTHPSTNICTDDFVLHNAGCSCSLSLTLPHARARTRTRKRACTHTHTRTLSGHSAFFGSAALYRTTSVALVPLFWSRGTLRIIIVLALPYI